jgi:hypothetical protein
MPPVTLKVVPWMYTGKKATNEREGNPEKKFGAAFRTIFSISKYFQRSNQNLTFIFLFNKAALKSHLHMYRKYWIIFIGLPTIIFFWWPNTFKHYDNLNKTIHSEAI